MRKIFGGLILASVLGLSTPSWAVQPFDEENIVVPVTKATVDAVAVSPASMSVEPVPIRDPLASATADARGAYTQLEALMNTLKTQLVNHDYKKAALSMQYIDKQLKDRKEKGQPVQGLMSRMKSGSVDISGINKLQGKLSSLKGQNYSEMVAALLKAARDNEGMDSSNGPGGGDVACAWFVSAVLRAAGLVPKGWEELTAETLTVRMNKEMGWNKVKAGKSEMPASAMKPGDIVFWSPNEHVGVYLGNGMAISNSSSAHVSFIHPVSGYYDGWVPRYVMRPPGKA
ncbi:MAG: NlpC/P60 family protein [Candidatus Ozemobacteraceae bacterium]